MHVSEESFAVEHSLENGISSRTSVQTQTQQMGKQETACFHAYLVAARRSLADAIIHLRLRMVSDKFISEVLVPPEPRAALCVLWRLTYGVQDSY